MDKKVVWVAIMVALGVLILSGGFLIYSSYKESSLENFYKNLNLETAGCLKSCPFSEVIIDRDKGIGNLDPKKTIEEFGEFGNAFEINKNCTEQCSLEMLAKVYNKFPTPTEPKSRDHYTQYSELIICMNMLKINKEEISNCLDAFILKYSS